MLGGPVALWITLSSQRPLRLRGEREALLEVEGEIVLHGVINDLVEVKPPSILGRLVRVYEDRPYPAPESCADALVYAWGQMFSLDSAGIRDEVTRCSSSPSALTLGRGVC